MATHPADINGHLAHAFSGIGRLIEDAKKRGDAAGADAWQVALAAVEVAEHEMARARTKQNWERSLIPKTDTHVPPREAVREALAEARESPCAKSQRGAVIYARENTDRVTGLGPVTIVGRGHNGPPWTGSGVGSCDRTDGCRRDCGKRCVHAESRALRHAQLSPDDGHRYDLVHVKLGPLPYGSVVTNLPMVTVAAGKGPSCWQCSREVMDANLAGVWLFEEVPTATSGEWDKTSVGEWRYYTAKEFHEETLKACGIHPYPPLENVETVASNTRKTGH